MSTLKKLQNYMGKRKVLLPAAMLLSALSALAGMLPYILIWLIVRELLERGEITSSGNVVMYAWWAAGMAVASIVLYFAALMSSHLAAFRVESYSVSLTYEPYRQCNPDNQLLHDHSLYTRLHWHQTYRSYEKYS